MRRMGSTITCTAGLVLCILTGAAAQPVAGEVAPESLNGKSLTFVSYGGILQDGQMAALKDFVIRSGVRLLSDGPTEIAKLRAQVEAQTPQWDVVDVGHMAPHVYCGTLFQKLDFSKIDISDIPAGQVGECSVPAMNYATMIVYKKSKYRDNPPRGWKDFFDLTKFPGTRALPGNTEPTAAAGMIELILRSEGVPQDKLFPVDMDRGLDRMRAIRDHTVFWQTGAESQQMIESGEADMAVVWSGRAMSAIKNGADYVPIWDDWLLFMDQLAIPVGAREPDAAYALLNAYVGKRSQEILSEKTSYSPIHKDAKPNVDAFTAQWLLNSEEKRSKSYQPNMKYWVEHYSELSEKWADFLAGG